MLKKQSKRARNEKVQGKKSKKLKKEQAKARKRQLKVQKKAKEKGTLNLAKIGSQTFYMYEVLFYLIIRLITLLHRFHIIAHDMPIDDIGGID